MSSKHFGGGRRLEEKPYAPRRGEDKRPSVFDRLGVREYDDNLPSSHPHYGGDRGSSGGGYRRDGPSGMRKHSPSPMQHNPMMTGRRNPDPRDRIRSRSRSRSFSPRSRKIPSEVAHHSHAHSIGGHGHGPMKKKPKDISPHHDHRGRRSTSPMRRKSDKPGPGSHTKSPNWRDNSSSMPRYKSGGAGGGGGGGGSERVKSKKSSGKKSGKKGGKAAKGRSSSGTSGSSGETSSSSRSASSSSSSSEGSSSSSSNASSSSDSSVPSIKLKHDKQKRKKPKRPSSKSESVSTGQIQSRISSGSSIESGNVRDNRDLREKIKAKSRQNYEKMHDGPPSDLRQRRPPDQYGGSSRSYNKPDLREHTPGDVRRRRSSGAGSSYDGSAKRRRVLSPEEYVPSPRRAPPPNDPPIGHQMRRDRSPLPRDRMRVIQSPMRRAPIEDRRNDGRGDISKRLDNYGDKHRDIDRYRDEGSGSYGRDNLGRQKERMAPARHPPPLRQHPHGGPPNLPPNQDRDRDRDVPPGSNIRFETRSRPLLQLPGTAPPTPTDPPKSFRNNPEDRVIRTSVHAQSPPPKHTPMIPKSKEALIEKYRGMKQSQYVDMWVDKTVEACGAPPSSIISPPPKDAATVSSKFEEAADPPPAKPVLADIGELLSDFSDDDAELLNDIGEETKSEKSEKSNAVVGKEKEKVAVSEAQPEVASSGAPPETPVQAEKKPIPTPVTPVVSQERKSIGTPQRSFLELNREAQSLPSRSQTEDDILERMDFEEISDDELGDVAASENKIPIVDALGVDWASLVCGEKNKPTSPSSVLSASSTSAMKVRKRWTPLQVISRVGLISNCSERLVQNIVQMKMKDETCPENTESVEDDPAEVEERIQDELQNAVKFRKMRARRNVIDTIGLGPNSRALSSRRDMALRRYYLGMPQKSLVSMDLLHQNSAASSVQDLDSIGELYRLSLSLFKGSETAAVIV